MAADPDIFVKAVEVAKSLPLWIFVAIAAMGFAALYMPAFGGADLTTIRNFSWIAWLAAVSGTILTFAKLADIVGSSWAANREEHRRRLWRASTNRYAQVYAPLVAKLSDVSITCASATGAAYFRQRLENARGELTAYKSRKRGIKKAWIALFDRKVFPTTGEVEYGGVFPIGLIGNRVREHYAYCDDKLIALERNAVETRMVQNIADSDLSEDDVKLLNHIYEQHSRLKKFLGR